MLASLIVGCLFISEGAAYATSDVDNLNAETALFSESVEPVEYLTGSPTQAVADSSQAAAEPTAAPPVEPTETFNPAQPETIAVVSLKAHVVAGDEQLATASETSVVFHQSELEPDSSYNSPAVETDAPAATHSTDNESLLLPTEAIPQVRVLSPDDQEMPIAADSRATNISLPDVTLSRSSSSPSTSIANDAVLPAGAVPVTTVLVPQPSSQRVSSPAETPVERSLASAEVIKTEFIRERQQTFDEAPFALNTDEQQLADPTAEASDQSFSTLLAQNRPSQTDRDRFQQDPPSLTIPEPTPIFPLPPEPPDESPVDEQEDTDIDMTREIDITRIDVVGNSILDEAIQAIVRPLENRAVSLSELQNATNEITELYLEQGYLTSRAELRPQTVVDGIIQIDVLESRIEKINVTGTEALNPEYVRSRVALGSGAPLNVNDLEDQLRLLLADPILSEVKPTLERGDNNQSVLTVDVTEAKPFKLSFSFDNYSPPLVGSERLGLNGRFLNPTGAGDRFSTSYYRSTTGGLEIFDIGYQIPLNPMNGILQVEFESANDNITQSSLDELDISGSSERYDISFRQPLVRSPEEEFALTLGFTHQRGQTFVSDRPFRFGFGPSDDGVTRTSVIGFGQDYTSRDEKGAWSFRSQFNIGTGLFDATSNSKSLPDGQFFSWLGQAQRLQVLDKNQLLVARLDLQLTPDRLLSSERFVIGGGQSVRGYRQNLRSGDNGFRLSVEDRITVLKDKPAAHSLVIAPFIDMGAVWNSGDRSIPGEEFLLGAGVGVLWEPVEDLNVRVDYGYPFIDVSDRSSNIQDDGLYFSLGYSLEF